MHTFKSYSIRNTHVGQNVDCRDQKLRARHLCLLIVTNSIKNDACVRNKLKYVPKFKYVRVIPLNVKLCKHPFQSILQ